LPPQFGSYFVEQQNKTETDFENREMVTYTALYYPLHVSASLYRRVQYKKNKNELILNIVLTIPPSN